MSFSELLDKYINFIISVNDTNVISYVTNFVFEDMENLPFVIKEEMNIYQEKIDKLEKEYKKMVDEGEDTKSLVDKIKNDRFTNPFVLRKLESTFYMSASKNLQEIRSGLIGFQRTHFIQEFLVYYTLLEAYIRDILRIILEIKPDILISKDDKNQVFTISEVVENRDRILDWIIEKRVYSWKSFLGYMNYLTRKAGYKFQITKDMKQLLEEIEQIRHCIVHNGGRVSKDFIQVSRLTDKEGDPLPLGKELTKQVYNFIRQLAFMVYTQTAIKFFNKDFEKAKVDNYYIKLISEKLLLI